MEETKTNTQTSTEQKWEGNIKDVLLNSDENMIKMDVPVFIVFAEFLGYISRFTKIANDWCDGKIPEDYIKKMLTVEAQCMLHQMKKDYTVATIRYWFNMYHPVILKDIEEKLADAFKTT
jgi:hypothetical protein